MFLTIRRSRRLLGASSRIFSSKPPPSPLPPGPNPSNRYTRPSPPPLPPSEQREFEELIKAANSQSTTTATGTPSSQVTEDMPRKDDDQELLLHPDARRAGGIGIEFEGDINPVTGEIGGPKRDPLKHGDWSQSGRVTDF